MSTKKKDVQDDELDEDDEDEDEDVKKGLNPDEDVHVTTAEELFAAIDASVEAAIAKAVSPLVRKFNTLEKAISGQSETLNEAVEQFAEIKKGLADATEGKELIKGILLKAEGAARTTPETKTPGVSTTAADIIAKSVTVDPNSETASSPTGLSPESVEELPDLISKARALVSANIPVPGYNLELLSAFNNRKPITETQVAALRKGIETVAAGA